MIKSEISFIQVRGWEDGPAIREERAQQDKKREQFCMYRADPTPCLQEGSSRVRWGQLALINSKCGREIDENLQRGEKI